MLTTRIIPCLDVHRGRVVRGQQFSADKDAGDPIELAVRYNEQSADELVYYDITASAEERGIFQDLVERTADQLFIPLTVGGGIRTAQDMRRMLMAGADKVSINTAAVENPDLINDGAEGFGSQCTVLSMDVKRVPQADGSLKWHVFTHGGRRQTEGEAVPWAIEGVERGAGEIVVNSIDADGTLAGYDLELLAAVCAAVDVPVIASGGGGTLDHLFDALDKGNAHAVLAASIFHYEHFTVREVKEYLAAKGIPMRLN